MCHIATLYFVLCAFCSQSKQTIFYTVWKKKCTKTFSLMWCFKKKRKKKEKVVIDAVNSCYKRKVRNKFSSNFALCTINNEGYILCRGECFNASLNMYGVYVHLHMCVMFQEINILCLFLLSFLIKRKAFAYKKSTWSCCIPMESSLNWKSFSLVEGFVMLTVFPFNTNITYYWCQLESVLILSWTEPDEKIEIVSELVNKYLRKIKSERGCGCD